MDMFLSQNGTGGWNRSLIKNTKNGTERDNCSQTKNGTRRNGTRTERLEKRNENRTIKLKAFVLEWNGTISKTLERAQP